MAELFFEELIGLNISELKYLVTSLELDENTPISFKNNFNHFFKKTFNHSTIKLNEEKIITRITIYFSEIIDQPFYQLLSKRYGPADSICVIDKITKYDPEFFNGQVLQETLTTLKEGSFEDNPYLIIWNKKKFGLRIHLQLENKITEVSFSKLS